MPFNETTFILFYVSSDCSDEITFYLMELLSNSYTIWNNYKNSKTVVLTSSVNREFFSCLLEETKIYPKEFEVERMERAKELNWFTELNFTYETISEYPNSP